MALLVQCKGTPGSPVWIVLILLILIAFCLAGMIQVKKCRVTSIGDRPLSSKEGKNCAKRFYIYIAFLTSNIVWAFAIYIRWSDVQDSFPEFAGVVPLIVGLCFVGDIFFINPKKFKYACKSFYKDEHDDSYERAPDAEI